MVLWDVQYINFRLTQTSGFNTLQILQKRCCWWSSEAVTSSRTYMTCERNRESLAMVLSNMCIWRPRSEGHRQWNWRVVKRSVEELVGNDTMSKYVVCLRVPDWKLVLFQAMVQWYNCKPHCWSPLFLLLYSPKRSLVWMFIKRASKFGY